MQERSGSFNNADFEPVIGLEVHVQLKTETKAFCSCPNRFGDPPNTNVCPVCLALPGSLPVLNKKALELAVKAALALNCKINPVMIFARKNYFYPDLPKNYQISQYENPLSLDGYIEIEIDGKKKKIGIQRLHMEEDAGKLIHEEDGSLVDLNRAGVPLIEIVSKPDINSPEEAYAYLTELKKILQYVDVSDCDMEKGSLRVDANVSVRPKGSDTLGTKTELKNMNSFRAVQKALDYEIKRQIKILKEGGTIVQETRLWDEKSQTTMPMRTKEEAHDYRYFPEPDLVPFEIDMAWVEEIKRNLPELPSQKIERFVSQYKLDKKEAVILTSSVSLADYFEQAAKLSEDAKSAAAWIINDLMGLLKDKKIEIKESPVEPSRLAKLIKLIKKNIISTKIAKELLETMFSDKRDPEEIVKEKGMVQLTDEDQIKSVVEEVIAENPKAVRDYKSGKKQVIGFFVGQVMKKTKGKANPSIVNKLLRELLENA